MYSTHCPTEPHLARLRSLASDINVSVASSEPEAQALARDANVILGHRYLRQSLPHAKQVRWVQSTAGGVDRLPLAELDAMNVMLTRCTVTSTAVARHAVALAWAVTRRIDAAHDRQRAGTWDNALDFPPLPRRAIVFGLGTIGRAISAMLHDEGIEVLGVRGSDTGEKVPGVSRIVSGETWRAELPNVDWCLLALPHTERTAGLFNEAVLRTLSPRAVLVNVGRGETVVNDDLAAVLRSGHLTGAALDVTAPKPTGPDDPFWQTPRLLITPHVAAHHADRSADTEAFIEKQVARYLTNEPLDNVVALGAEVA